MFQSTAKLTSDVFFFMCFFVNNQFRIIVEESSTGSENLEAVFESNLKRIGRMVAILDSWDQPVYLSRVWTVYEQFVASTIQIEALQHCGGKLLKPTDVRRFLHAYIFYMLLLLVWCFSRKLAMTTTVCS